jgi:hypothetical protein
MGMAQLRLELGQRVNALRVELNLLTSLRADFSQVGNAFGNGLVWHVSMF